PIYLGGTRLGSHEGIEMFTIGQRKGLPGGAAQPRYVVDIDPKTNRIIVGDADDLLAEGFELERVNWHPVLTAQTDGFERSRPSPHDCITATVKIRYNHPGTAARISLLDTNRCRVQLHE